MAVVAVTVTEFSRGLSNFLNQVQYQGQTLDIQRGKKLVARVLPATATEGFPIAQLDEMLAKMPQISAAERLQWVEDLDSLRTNFSARSNPWAL